MSQTALIPFSVKTATKTAWEQHVKTRRRIRENRVAYIPSKIEKFDLGEWVVVVKTMVHPSGIQVRVGIEDKTKQHVKIGNSVTVARGGFGMPSLHSTRPWAESPVKMHEYTRITATELMDDSLAAMKATRFVYEFAEQILEQVAALDVCPVRPNLKGEPGEDFPEWVLA